MPIIPGIIRTQEFKLLMNLREKKPQYTLIMLWHFFSHIPIKVSTLNRNWCSMLQQDYWFWMCPSFIKKPLYQISKLHGYGYMYRYRKDTDTRIRQFSKKTDTRTRLLFKIIIIIIIIIIMQRHKIFLPPIIILASPEWSQFILVARYFIGNMAQTKIEIS